MLDLSELTVLIVDDTKTNIDILVNGLSSEPYSIAVAIDGESALDIVSQEQPDLILLDIMMPDMDGHEVCRRLKNNPQTAMIPVIFLTALENIENKTAAFEGGAVDYITKPFDMAEVKARVKTHLELSLSKKMLADQNRQLEYLVQKRTRELNDVNLQLAETQIEVVMRLGLGTEMRDDETGAHVQRIRKMVEIIASKTQTSDTTAELWGLASTMHDVGKVGIPDAILLKPGKLTEQEFAIMRSHTIIGAKILSDGKSELIRTAHDIALSHHEKWNGSGYPKKLKGNDIPLAGRITALADVFDALLSRRPYKEPWPLEKVTDLINSERTEHFDPEIVDLFMEALPEIIKSREHF